MCHLFYSRVWALCVSAGSRVCLCTRARAGLSHFPFLCILWQHFHPLKWQISKKEWSQRVPEQSLCLPGLGACWAWATSCLARLDPSVLFGPAVIWERLQQRCFGCVLDPSQSAISSSQMRRVTAVEAQPTHLLAMLVSELDVSPIVRTNRLKWTANIYAASINVPDAGSEHPQVCQGSPYWKSPMVLLPKPPSITANRTHDHAYPAPLAAFSHL